MADTSIRTYRAKRDFQVTKEPAPRAPVVHGSMFVVQKHRARRAGLHWDFRLEHGGVLWSWAVPRGPSLDPADRRMAIHVEDHPVDYAEFQGAIPDGEYGAGTVETWDRGTWTPLDDPEYGMAKGHLHFALAGGRLNGRFNLVRAARRDPRKPEAWFLIKVEDEHARAGQGAVELEQAPPPAPPPAVRKVKRAVRGALPEAQAPQLCTLVRAAPSGDAWLTEIKFDGYRILAAVDAGAVRLLTRNGLDWADRMPAMAAAFRALGVGTALIDGEMVSLRADGVSSFPGLQEALTAGRDDRLTFYAFDLLHLDGQDLRPAALRDRKAALSAVLAGAPAAIRVSDHVEGDPAAMHARACAAGLEGIVCKRADAPYRAGRGPAWVKVKCQGRDELVVLGWTQPAGSRTGFGALHVGYYDDRGRLQYAGGVGSGFDRRELDGLRTRLDALAADVPPGMLVSGDPIDSGIAWVRPELVIEVEYTGWSGAGRLRHPVFLGVREDKAAAEVVREVADPDAPRAPFRIAASRARKGWHGAVPPAPKPVAASSKPMAASSKPMAASPKPAAASPNPKAAPSKPVVASSKPKAEPSAARAAPSKPVIASSKPKAEPPAPKAAPSKPVIASSKPKAEPSAPKAAPSRPVIASSKPKAAPPKPATAAAAPAARPARIVAAKPPGKARIRVGGVDLTHPDRALWPGITKLDLAEYWRAVADHALPGLARRPLSIVRCPDGIEGERFFQKNGHGYLPPQIREGKAGSQPYLAIDDADGLFAMAQMSAIELHPWGAAEADPDRPDRLVFDLDPGEGVPFTEVVTAARDVRARLAKLGLDSRCRTTGGKGLHVVVPLRPAAGWDAVKPFCRAFAETMAADAPEQYVAHVKIADRRGKILVDWLRNGLGATAVASFCPRARPGAGVATPLAWSELTARLDPGAHTVLTVPKRLARQTRDPWDGFDAIDQRLPDLAPPPAAKAPLAPPSSTRIVTARKPKKRS